MSSIFRYTLLGLIIGALIGYALFGKIADQYVSPKKLITLPKNELVNFGQKLTGVAKIRQDILWASIVGAGVGLVFSILPVRRR